MIDPLVLSSMRSVLVKEALLGTLAGGALSAASRKLTESGASAALKGAGRTIGAHLSRSAGNIGAGMGIGAAGGGILGAVQGGRKGYQQAQEQGDSGTMGALTGALSGSARGAALGTAAGGLVGLASGGRGSDLVNAVTSGRYNPLGAAARSGQRRLHSVTGLVPGGAKRGTDEYVKALTDINAGGLGTQAKELTKAEAQVLKAKASRDASKDSFDRAVQAAQSGQTSLVGLAQGLKEKGLVQGGKDILQHGVANQWRNSGALGKATMLGVPLGGAALAAMQGGNSEDIGSALGGGVASALTPMLGSTGGSMVSRAGSTVGGTIGKGINKLVGTVKRSPGNNLGSGINTPGASPGLDSPPVERVYTDAALGRPPESLQT